MNCAEFIAICLAAVAVDTNALDRAFLEAMARAQPAANPDDDPWRHVAAPQPPQ